MPPVSEEELLRKDCFKWILGCVSQNLELFCLSLKNMGIFHLVALRDAIKRENENAKDDSANSTPENVHLDAANNQPKETQEKPSSN